ncbi:hypothetical protein EV46_07535 [Pectobacterium atrosepticum]|nr:non-ribosomal peptide synthetase [Pectobacterium atrosepticum]AIA70439.1 hypothetical protein EV46_07535 [Pectobacterium atrosepticum]
MSSIQNNPLENQSILNSDHSSDSNKLPLSSTQQVVWLDQTLNPESPNYNIGTRLRIDEHLDETLFNQAFERLVARHDALHLQLIHTHGLPLQALTDASPSSINVYDFSHYDDAEERAQQHIHATFMRPFDLRGKLWASELLRVSDTHRYWQFCCHHLIADGWSLKLLVNELVATYNQLKNSDDNAGEVAPSYLDYISEDLIYLDSRHYQSDLKFWLDRYKTLPPALIPPSSQNKELTNELPPPHLWQLKNEYFHKIENIAAEHGLSVLHFMYAILACYFSRTTETEDIVIGIPIHNRRNAKQKNTIGMFSSVIPIGVSIKKEDSFLDIMRNVAAELRRCYKHQRLPITEINQHTRIRQKTGRAQLFDITLSLEWFEFNVHMEGTNTTFQTPHRATQFPLAISIYQYDFENKNHPVTVEFNFDTRYLSREDVMAIQSRLATLVDAAITSLDMTVEHAPILPPTERQQVVVDFNATDADFPQHTLIHERFEQQVELTPDATAVIFEEQSLSYAELNRRANQLAHRLLTLGIKPDDRVALCVERSLEMVVGLMGILKSGAAYVPLDPTYPAERLAYMIDDAKPVALLTQANQIAIQTADIPAIMLDTDSFDAYATSNPDAQALGVTSTHLAYVIYTSGSTGKPKGVMVTHRNVLNLASGLKTLLAFEHSNRIALNASIVFDASVQNWIQILSGHTLVIVPDAIRTDARQLWHYFSHHAIDLFDCTPVQLQWLLDAGLGTDPDYQPAQVLIGGDAISQGIWSRLQQLTDTRFINVYGPTECTVDATACPIDSSQSAPTIGRPLTNTEVYILGTQGQPVPIGVTGEIYIGGAGVARGYLNRPDLTAERFITNPFVDEQEARLYKTGDLGYWRHDGSITYLGRNDFQVKLRGFRLELGEIETLLIQYPGIQEAVVILREDIPGDKRLVAYFQAQPDTQPTPADLRLQLSQRLAEYMIPSAFVALDAFPLTPNGKLDRKALPEPDKSAMVTRHYEAPQGEMETMLASIWQTLLGIDHVSRYDHFFELGGQSLMVVSLIEQLRNQGKTLDVRSAFSAPVLYEMARAIQNHQDDTALVIPPNLIHQDCTTITPDQLPLIALSQFEIDTITSTVPGGVTNVQDIYPLAPLQEGIFFHRLYQQTGDVYQLDLLVAFDTRERLDIFLNTLQKVIDRHDILRTAICWQGLSQPVQVVWRHAPLPVNTFEPASSEDITAQLQAYISPQTLSLDLNKAPLLAADIVYDPSRSEWLMALRVHHLVSDHMTLDLIIAEVRLMLWGKTDELSPPQPYRNFIAHVLSIPNAVHEQYFRSRLADVDTPTIPFGLAEVQDYDGEMAEATLSLDHNLVDAIHHHARQLSVSPGVLFHVAWAQVLAQISDSSDVIFGSVLLGRLQGFTGADRVMGMFVNTLPLRIPLNDRSVLDIVNSTNNELLSLLEHEQAPLALAQRCSSVAPPMPLFSTLLNYRRTQANTAATTWEGMTLLAESRRTTYPFNFSVDDQGDSIEILSQTIASVDPARIARYLETALHGLVEALKSDPQTPILSISILPAEERQKLLVDFNATAIDFPDNSLIHSLFETQVEQTPDATAIVFEEQHVTYDELNRRANRLAHHLLSFGVKPDDRVAICLERSPDMVVGLLGILKAGAAYVPLDPSYPAERLAYMLDDADPVALLTHSSLIESFSHTSPTIVLDNAAPFDACPDTNPVIQGLNAAHLAYIIYTSGSTGKPKGVMVEHRGLSNYIQWAREYYVTSNSLDSIVSSPVAFDATVTSLYLPLLCGGKIQLIHDGQELTELLPALLATQPGTLIKITPTHLAALGQELQSTHRVCPDLLFVVGGEALSSATVALWQTLSSGSRIINEYGPTETVVGCITFDACTPNSLTDNVPIGRPIANTCIYILDAKGQPAPVGVAGEIYIGGAGVARGYLNRPDLTAERFIADPFSDSENAQIYKTGDLGRWLPDGNIEYLGRNDFQIKVRGFRIEPGEIEARLMAYPGVREALVIAREDSPGDIRLVAYLIAQPGSELIPSVLRKALALHLAEYMVPSAFVTLDAFPLTPNGKLDRKALPVPEQSAIVSRGYEAPVGELEMALTEIWQNLLGLERVGRHDHFFELGGHSILAVQCVTRVRQMLGLDLQVQKIFANPVLSDLAQELTNTSTIAVTAIPLADRSQPLPLSFSQQRLWFLIQLEPTASRAYNLPAALRLIGRFDRKAFITALDGLVARHESLRTRVTSIDGQPCQKIDPATIGFSLSCLDLRTLNDKARAQRVSELAAQESRAPFNLAEGPLIRGQLLQLGDEIHVMLLTMHHIVSDGWSIGILARELAALYQAALEGSEANLPPLPVQYADYTVWQRQWLQGETLNDLRDFWRNQLQGAPALLEIPTDRPRPSVQRYEGNILPVSLDPEELAALKSLCRQQGTTLFMTLLAVWSVVLSRLSGQGDIVVGTPLANRKHSETEGLIGFFVNTLALRITPSQCQTVGDLFAQIRERAIAAYTYQDLPFEQVVETLQPARSLSYSPIFQVMLSLNNTPMQDFTLPGLEISAVERPQRSTHFDMTLSLTETENGLEGGLIYSTDLFDHETIVRLRGYLRNVLMAMADDVTQPVATLPMLPDNERRQVMLDFNATEADFPHDALIHQLVEDQAARTPDTTAVLFEDQHLTYDALNRRANQLAHHLIDLGVQPDDRIAICVERSLDMVIGLLAILKAGAAYVPLDPGYPAERLAYMLDDASPVALLTQANQRALLTGDIPRILLDTADFSHLSEDNPHIAGLDAHHLAYVIYTSGSTGKPKGVMNSHRGLCNRLVWMQNTYRLTPDDRVLQKTPFSFDVSVWEFFWPLLYGARLVMARPDGHKDAAYLAQLIERTGITTLHFVPSMLQQFVQWADADCACDSLRRVICSGEALPAELQQRFFARFNAQLHNLYGPTEAAIDVTFWACQPDDHRSFVPIGRPIANTQLYILDTLGQPVPLGVAGELHIGGVGVARGYLNRPDLTAERFIPDPFSNQPGARLYKTGDLARWLPDGSLEYLGRNDFQVKLRGFRIELGEIEARLMQCPGVQEAVVVAREDSPGDTRLVAYLCPQPGVTPDPADLRQQLGQHLAEYMVPGAFVTLDAFPLTPNGKLDRKALPAPDQTAFATRDYEAPQGGIETALAALWQELLGLDRVGRHDQFFALGGHSLLAVQLLNRMNKAGMDVALATLFAHPTLCDLAAAVTATAHDAPFTLPVADRTQPLPLSFSQQRLWFLAQFDPAASQAYHLPAALHLTGRLDRPALTTALNGLVARHESLRTRFTSIDGQPAQQIDPDTLGFSLSSHDLRKLDEAARTTRVAELAEQEARARFDLTQGPLIRGQLLQLDDNTHVLLLTQHHIISDGWSIGILARELAALYQAALEGSEANLPPLPVQYADYAVWQRQWLQGETLNDLRDYWRDQLQGAPALLEIPTDRPRPSVQRYAGDQVPFHLDAGQLRRLHALNRQQGTTLFMTLLAAWSVVLSRLSGQDDIVIGTPVANRPRQELEGMVGFFVNTLALRTEPGRCHAVADLLDQVRERALDAYAHQALPFEQVVEILQPARSLSYSPIFQVMLSLNNTPAQALTLPDLTLSAVERPQHSTHFDLSLSLIETENGLNGGLVYATDLFDRETILRVVGYVENILMAMADDVTQPVATLPILPDSERRQVMLDFNATEADFPHDALIHQLVEDQAARTPDTTAVLFEDQHLTYDALNRRANQLAHHLIDLGVKPDDRIAICVERSLDMVIGLLAILKAGAAYVPLDPGYPAERLAYMLDDASPVALLTQANQRALLTGDVPRILLDTADFSHLSEDNPHVPGLDAHHLAYVIYTSGSTGKPKGVMNSHRALCNRLVWMQNTYRLTPDDRVLQKTPFSFDVSVWEFFWPLLYGARLVMARPDGHKDAAYLAQLIERTGITTLHFVPSMLQQFVQWADADCACDSLRRVICSGEALPAELQQRFFARFNAQLHNLYGPTEAAIDVTFWACQPDDHRSFVPIGRPIANTQLYILDTLGQPVPLGVAGELHIGGVGVARGYLNRPDLTAERFIPDPFINQPGARLYKTGDLARWLPDGSLEYLGRNDFQVKLRGFRIELGEIEARLMQCPGVQEAVVVAREDSPGDTRLVAYLCPQPGVTPDPADLRQQLGQHLAEYMVPGAFVTLDAFPLTPNGKLDRKALPAPDQSAVATRDYEAPQGEVETALAAVWQDLLGLTRVGRHDHFFALGGHSLLIVSLIERLRRAGLALDVRGVFSTPVLSDMAQAILAHQDKPAVVVPPNRIPADSTAITPDLLPLVTLTQPEIDRITDTVSGGASNIQDIYPLAPLQEGILFHHLLQEQGDTYLLRSMVAFTHRERLDAFLSALQQVIDRHDILRTAVCWQDLSQPVQVVWRQAILPINHFEPTSPEDVLAQLQAHTEPRTRRIDLSQAPLFRADIAHDPLQNEWLLALSFHHLISDHMTLALIVGEIRLLLQHQADALPTPLPYRNFIAQTLSVPNSAHEAYFRDKLADVDEPTAPFGLLNVQGSGGDIHEARLVLDATLASAIRQQARHLGVSPGVLFHVAWAQVLAQTSGRDDVVFGSVLLGRLAGAEGADRIMGMFINTLPLRISLADRGAAEVVERTSHDLMTLLEHEQAPLALAQRCSGVAPPMPLFSTLLNYRHTQASSTDNTLSDIRVLTSEERTNYPLTLAVDDRGEGFSLVAQTLEDIDPHRLLNYLMTAISSLVDALETEPQRSILNLPVLPDSERQQMLVDFNATDADIPRHALIHELFEAQVACTPDAIAVVFGEASLSYDELNRRANRLAHHLISFGVRPDERVAICVERGLDMVVGLLGILKAGGAYVPLDPTYPVERLRYMLDDAKPVALISQSAHLGIMNGSLPVILLDDGETRPFDNEPDTPLDARKQGLTPRHLAYVIYTSGSTGKPKGVMVEHANMVNFLCSMRKEPGIAQEDVLLGVTSLSFDISILEIFLPLLNGARLILATQAQAADAQQLAMLIERHAVSFMQATPSTWRMLVELRDFALPPGFKALCGGEALPENLATALLQKVTTLWNLYGPTETTIWSTLNGLTTPTPYIGHPIANTQIYILDAQGRVVPLGVAGEIHIAGAGVVRGYLGRPDLTAERFITDPFSGAPEARMYKTGDLGRWLPDGTLEYLGRNDFQVKVRGFRIELGEIETRLARCHGVHDAVVIAREDSPGDKRLVAYLLAQPDTVLEPADLRQRLSEGVAEYMIPSAFVTLDAFPLTPNGKLDRKALPAPDQSAMATRGYEAPQGDLEHALAQIWQTLLGVERVGRHDHFFELGGHSLLAVQLNARIRAEFLTDIPIVAIFQHPQLSALAEVILAAQIHAAWGNDTDALTHDLDSMSAEELMAILDGDTNDE